jgi:hypothetical protein
MRMFPMQFNLHLQRIRIAVRVDTGLEIIHVNAIGQVNVRATNLSNWSRQRTKIYQVGWIVNLEYMNEDTLRALVAGSRAHCACPCPSISTRPSLSMAMTIRGCESHQCPTMAWSGATIDGGAWGAAVCVHETVIHNTATHNNKNRACIIVFDDVLQQLDRLTRHNMT